MSRWPLPTALVVTLIAGIAVGWTRDHGRAVQVWAASPYVKLQPAAEPVPWRPTLVAPLGGRASFQLVVDGGRAVRPSLGPLLGPGGTRVPGAVSIARELTVPVSRRSASVPDGLLGDVPDPLVPLSFPAPKGQRKVLLATSIAETSMTIESVRIFLYSGLARVTR